MDATAKPEGWMPSRRSAWLALGPFAATVAIGPQLLGGVHPWGMVAHGVGAWLALAVVLWWLPARRRRLPAAYWGVLGLWLWTWLPALPLPCEFTRWLNPMATARAQQAWALLDVEPLRRCALSADPGRTREEVVKWTAVLACFLCASVLARAGYRKRVLVTVGVSAGLMTLSCLGHLAAGTDRVFGIYSPLHVGRQLFRAPLLNMNNLGGFLVLGVAVQYGLAQIESDRRARHGWYALAVLTAITAVLTRSRGAIGALLLLSGVLLVQRLRVDRRRRGGLRASVRRFGPPLLLAAIGVGVGLYVLREPLVEVFREGALTKVDLWRLSLPLAYQQPLIGLGRGAFSAAFVGVHGVTGRFVYPENFVIQWAVEWGVPAALGVLGVLAWRLARVLVAGRGRKLRSATAAGLAIYAFQNLFDLGLEVVSCASVAAAALGGLASRPRAGGAPRRRSRAGFHGGWLLAPAAIALVWYGPQLSTGSVPAIREALERAALDRSATPPGLIERGLRLHPQEPVIPYYAGALALARGDAGAARWINHALSRAPGWAGPHVLAARYLWAQGRARQAAVEVRLAAERDPAAAKEAACALVNKAPDLARLTLPAGPTRRTYLTLLSRCVPADTALAGVLDRVLIREFPDEPGPWVREGRRMRKAGNSAGARELLRGRLRRNPNAPGLWAALLDLHLSASDPSRMLAVVREAERHVGRTEALLVAEARAHALLGDVESMEQAWAQLRSRAAGDDRALAHAYWVLGHMELQLGRKARALSAFVDAFRIGDHTPSAVTAAELAEDLGDVAQAYMWWRKVCAAAPDDARACAAAGRLAETQGGIRRNE